LAATVPDTEKLKTDPDFRLVAELGFEEMVPFVFSQIRDRGLMSWLYFISTGAMLVYVILQVIWGKQVIWQLVGGVFAGSFLVIPFHELIHALAYRLLGAKKIIFGADLKQFIFYVTADRYPVSGASIVFLAMLPFILINLCAFIVAYAVFPEHLIFFGVFLLSHNIMCIGDFAISNYVVRSSGKVYSFDVPEEKKSYYYEKRRQQES